MSATSANLNEPLGNMISASNFDVAHSATAANDMLMMPPSGIEEFGGLPKLRMDNDDHLEEGDEEEDGDEEEAGEDEHEEGDDEEEAEDDQND